ncbi:MAG: DUF6054 family protein [Saprospiraceae bacterium]
MKISRFKVSKTIQTKLISYLTTSFSFEYKNIVPEITILAKEEFYFRTGSNQLNLIVINTIDSYLYIDIIGGGGGKGLFGITWGSEMEFVRKTQNMIKEFCAMHQESIEIVE